MFRSSLALSFLLALVAIAPARGPDAKIADGRATALRVCAICHVLADDQAVAPTLKPPVPSFTETPAQRDRSFLTRFSREAPRPSAGPERDARLSDAELSRRRGNRLSHEPDKPGK
jgi:mono/diheme cytochrome c family protein